ncbi:MAG: nucleoside-diphosphate sugar epimerase/dehydratase [Pseudomonadota bacterium]
MLKFIQSLSRTHKRLLTVGIDLALIPVALVFCFTVQALPQSTTQLVASLVPALPYLFIAALGASIWLEIPQVRLKDFEGRAVLRFATYSTVLVAILVPLAILSDIPLLPTTYLLFGLSYFALGVFARFMLRGVLVELYRRAQPARRVLIYGAGTTGTELSSALRAHHSIDPVAFIDDNPSLQGLIVAGLPVYAPTQLARVVEERGIERVLVAVPSLSPPKQMQIARRMQDMGLEVQVLPSFSQLIGAEPLIDKFISLPGRDFLGRAEEATPLGEAGDCYRGRSVLITGAGGSIGSELSRQVLECAPKRLVLFELSEYALYTIDMEIRQLAEGMDIEIVPVLGSVTDGRLVRKCLADHDISVVLHAAAYKHVPLVEINQLAGLANNILGTQVLARESFDAGIERFILISTDKAVRPTNVMGASKRFAELVVQDLASRVPPGAGPRYSMVRFGNVLGSSGSVIPLFQDQIRRGGPVTVTHRNVTRYFMTVQEATKLVLRAGAMAEGGEVYVLDMGKPVPILNLARQTIEASGYTVRDDVNPDGDIEIAITGLRPGEKMHEELTISDDHRHTAHAKIFSAREASLSEIEVARTLRVLREALAVHDVDAARAAIENAVREYASDRDQHGV